MFGVFMRRWRPKRVSNNERNESPSTDGSVSPEPPDRPPGKAKVHPEENTQALAYESFRRKSKPKTLQLEENNQMYNHLANTNIAISPVYPLTPNICVEGGKIEFIKTPTESVRNSAAFTTPPQSPLLAARRSSRDKRERQDEITEKFDGDKELLEKRIKQLESEVEEERRRTQRERMAVIKLQNKLIKREGAARSDAERERRARGDWEARARAADADAARLAAKLHAAQREISRMEETVQSLLQYKSSVDVLKQEKASLSTALETSAAQYANQVSTLGAENERLRGQLATLTGAGCGTGAGEHERRLDDVAQQVVRALLSQKSVRDELCCARARVRELEAQNRALSALLVRQLRPQPRPSPATPHTPNTPHDIHVHVVESGSCGALALAALSADDKRRHHILADVWTELKGLEVTPANLARALSAVEPALWATPSRPATLSLGVSHHAAKVEDDGKCVSEEAEGGSAGAESPESGAKDEGYSTMSSDVQADASRQSEHAARALPDLNEASDETDNQTIVSMDRHPRLAARPPDDLLYLPLAALGGRGSYPPARPMLPFQHVMRSFSDSHLCLKLLAGACTSSRLDSTSAGSGVLVLDLTPVPERPLRRALPPGGSSERGSWGSTVDERAHGSQYDAEYVQHWLELDDARSALQQRHRDLADLDYDRAELEDWSLSLSCEDLPDRHSPFADIATPGQISLSTLPSIREDDALELDEDVGECLWNECGFAAVDADDCRPPDELDPGDRRWRCAGARSPGGSWSTGSDAPDVRSAAAFSEDGDCPNVGLDFTRDFYRLVKYESTKSLASTSSRGLAPAVAGIDTTPLRVHDVQAVALQDREQALQNVLNFIAEQQKYCRDREETDSAPSRPVSEVRELPPPYAPADFDDESGPRSDLSDDRLRPDSFGSFSEGDSCNILLGDPHRPLYCESVSEPRSTPRFIEREDPYVESEDYYNEYLTIESEVNEEDHHLLNVQRKNEINRSIDLNNAVDESEESPPSSASRPNNDPMELNERYTENDRLVDAIGLIVNRTTVNVDVDPDEFSEKSPSFPSCGEPTSPTEVSESSTCRRTELGTVPEEEEGSSPDGSSPQLTESVTTSTSTTETVILSNKESGAKKESRSKNERSRIPTLLGKRPPPSPSRVRSRIPVAERRPHTDVIVRQEQTLSFHEAATSKDVIDELNRMIRQSESSGTGKKGPSVIHQAHKDNALWAPTGWVHVEKDIDFSDPKARANLLDVMLASSDSSPSSCGSSPAEPPAPAPPAQPYSRLHRLHRSRRQKTAAALRSRGLAVLRETRSRRPSILGREGFFVRFGPRERHALSSFDFLDELASPDPPKDCT